MSYKETLIAIAFACLKQGGRVKASRQLSIVNYKIGERLRLRDEKYVCTLAIPANVLEQHERQHLSKRAPCKPESVSDESAQF